MRNLLGLFLPNLLLVFSLLSTLPVYSQEAVKTRDLQQEYMKAKNLLYNQEYDSAINGVIG